ncbi:dimethyl sulfoxide reductase anchor subunit [Pseudodesulfovibrio thermohalotolerans]|uniref:DmsC/YnfH family molybdoenzyme membrane anchor subunit n=1 Tax=Pseudodesulfovibrio thermohalotolerans TaxID=2880651 RepID=UPI0022B9D60D|nr:DmsC/YnfH family molybdoenzyme membrane anchor subunit [Pseudodesulfovibrio thermohalotolerans]WFS63153.1 dimethyl sulfoxide reductase anchor subunit [Pseudodesulfovibrio thermohalotolerans]
MTYEYPLVFFTVFGQLSAGIALLVWLTGLRKHPAEERLAWLVALAALAVSGLSAALHLQSYLPAAFALSNVGSSWLSREILMGVVFFVLIGLRVFNVLPAGLNWLVGIGGVAFVLVMSQIYVQNASVPLWNSWGTALAFLGTMLLLGGTAALALAPEGWGRSAVAASVSAAVAGALLALSLPAFWLGGMMAPLNPVMLGVFASAAICVTLTQAACYAVGGALAAYGVPGRRGLVRIGFVVVLVGAVVGRMLFYAANIGMLS